MDKLDKIDFLFNLVEEMEGISFDEVLEKVLVNGFSMIHPTFHFYLNSDEKYVDVIYDMERRLSLLWIQMRRFQRDPRGRNTEEEETGVEEKGFFYN